MSASPSPGPGPARSPGPGPPPGSGPLPPGSPMQSAGPRPMMIRPPVGCWAHIYMAPVFRFINILDIFLVFNSATKNVNYFSYLNNNFCTTFKYNNLIIVSAKI